MVLIHKGFDVDINASFGASVVMTEGTLFDDNNKLAYLPGKRKFDKIKNSSKWVYYDIRNSKFIQVDSEISMQDLDSKNQHLCPIVYIETNSNNDIIKLIKLKYGEGYNLPPPSGGDLNSISLYKNIGFITEKGLTINGTTVTTTHKIYHIFNLFIYDMGDVILGTMEYDNKTITLQEDVSPAICEVTYGYLLS